MGGYFKNFYRPVDIPATVLYVYFDEFADSDSIRLHLGYIYGLFQKKVIVDTITMKQGQEVKFEDVIRSLLTIVDEDSSIAIIPKNYKYIATVLKKKLPDKSIRYIKYYKNTPEGKEKLERTIKDKII